MSDYKRYEQYCYNEFVDAFLSYAGTRCSRKEALQIAKSKVNPQDFMEGSSLAHKGPRWVAMRVARSMGLRD